MLITTSRKPSPRTRSFAKSLERVLNSKYINRGKMCMRDVFIKSRFLGYNKTVIISEMKGNPSRIDFHGPEGDLILSLDITASNSISTGRVKKKKLRLKWELEKQKSDLKEKIISIIEIPEKTVFDTLKKEGVQNSDSNLILVKGGKGSKSVVEFHDQQGQITGPRIYIRNCRSGG